MGQVLISLGFGLVGYVSGSLPFAVWITRVAKGIDVRDAGSGHATTTNTIRQAGWGAGLLVFIGDVAKGWLPTSLALRYAPLEWTAPLAATMAVIGHCWPLFAGFRGGMGLATAGGSILAVYPLGFPIGLGIVILLTLITRHGARASFFTGLLLAPVFYLLGQRGTLIILAVGVGVVLAVRFLSDWNRKYREIWLDREKPA